MRAMLVLLGLFCIVALGCATTSEEKTLTSGPPADVAGTWTGWGGGGLFGGAVTLTLDQKGTDLTGNILMAGASHLSGPVKGTVTGSVVRLSTSTVSYPDWRVNEDTMTGYISPFGPLKLRRSR
jgi:hypothetical protein